MKSILSFLIPSSLPSNSQAETGLNHVSPGYLTSFGNLTRYESWKPFKYKYLLTGHSTLKGIIPLSSEYSVQSKCEGSLKSPAIITAIFLSFSS